MSCVLRATKLQSPIFIVVNTFSFCFGTYFYKGKNAFKKWNVGVNYKLSNLSVASISPALRYPGDPAFSCLRIWCRRWLRCFRYSVERRPINAILFCRRSTWTDRMLPLWSPRIVIVIDIVLWRLFVIDKVNQQIHEHNQAPSGNDDTNDSERT